METVGKTEIWSFFDSSKEPRKVPNTAVRNSLGHRVGSFLELATKIAELQFRNRDHVLLFRGQEHDYRNLKENTTLKPSLFRPSNTLHINPTTIELTHRFDRLKRAEELLLVKYSSAGFLGRERIQRHRVLRWAILQHYEVCPTPLLDVTHSLRISASFASLGRARKAFIFVLAVPNLSGAVTASAEAGIQIMRLASVCPPAAVRPHIQEGYLLGEYPELSDYGQKEHYHPFEIDFGRRLVAKFVFDPRDFWKHNAFPMVSKAALYPDLKDPLFKLTQEVKSEF